VTRASICHATLANVLVPLKDVKYEGDFKNDYVHPTMNVDAGGRIWGAIYTFIECKIVNAHITSADVIAAKLRENHGKFSPKWQKSQQNRIWKSELVK